MCTINTFALATCAFDPVHDPVTDGHAHSTHSMLGAQDDLFKQRAPPSTTIVNEITIKFNIICLTGQHCAAEAARRPLRKIK